MNAEKAGSEYTWKARNVRPIIGVYVMGVFVLFILAAHFIFHSPSAVKALFLAAVGALVPLFPAIMKWSEYHFSESGLEKKSISKNSATRVKMLFLWEELSHIVPAGPGFKYYKKMGDFSPVARFFKRHFSDKYSGEFQVEKADREDVIRFLRQKGLLN